MSDVERLFMCLLVIYLLWGHVCSSPLPIFWSGCLFSHWVVELLHIFWTLITYQINALQIFPPILWIVFSLFLDSILWGTKVQNFDEVWFIFFNCLCFWCHTLKNWRIQNVKIFTCAFLSKRFIALALRCSLWSILRWCELVLGDSWPQSSACRCPAFPPRWSENTAQCRKPLPIALNGQAPSRRSADWHVGICAWVPCCSTGPRTCPVPAPCHRVRWLTKQVSERSMNPATALPLQDGFGYLGPLKVLMKFRMFFSISAEDVIGILMGTHWICSLRW